MKKCEWTIEETGWDTEIWETECGEEYEFGEYNGHAPDDVGWKFCPYCGRRIKET